MGGQEMTQRTPAQQLVAVVRGEDFRQQAALALPEGVSVDRFTRATVTALMANPELAQQADHDTIFTAILRSAQAGLVPDGKEAAIVVFNGKAQFMEMIGGARKVAGEHGWALDTAVVKQADEFEYEKGLEPKVRHVVRPGERGQTVAAYCIARHSAGQKLVEVMMIEELEQIRATSKKSGSGPWKDWTDRMYEKTVGKRMFAKLPLGDLDQRVIRIREATDTPPAEAARMIYGHEIEEPPAQLPAGTGGVDHASEMTASPLEGAAAAGTDAQQAEPTVDPPAAGSAPGLDDELAHEPGLEKPAESPFQAPAGVRPDDDPAVFAAKHAAEVVVPIGQKWKGTTLADVHAAGDVEWFRYALSHLTDSSGTGETAEPKMRPGALIQAIRAYVRVYLPDLYEAAGLNQEQAA